MLGQRQWLCLGLKLNKCDLSLLEVVGRGREKQLEVSATLNEITKRAKG